MEIKEVEVNLDNWLAVYKKYLEYGYAVRLKVQTKNGQQKLSIVYGQRVGDTNNG